jgi:methyl-accepting chemotaxis protein
VTTSGILAEMSASDLALVVLTVCSVVSVVAVLFALQRVLTTVRQVTATLEEINARAVPLIDELAQSLAEATDELARVERLVGSAESISATVDATSKLAYRALSAPVIKTVAVTSGASRAARRLRGEDSRKR